MSRPLAAAGVALLCLSGCPAGGRSPEGASRDRAPAPLDSLAIASDARFDSLGFLAGSFVGEGTERAVHLISSDTSLIAELARRYAPGLPPAPALWDALRLRGQVAVSPRIHQAMVGSPLGHTEVKVTALLLHGGRCGGTGAQAELVVEDRPEPGDPPLRGPVLGSILASEAPGEQPGLVRRPEVSPPGPGLVDTLIARTRRDLDSTLAAAHPGLGLEPSTAQPLEVNTLADLDAADVIAVRMAEAEVGYAVSLRERRRAGTDTLVEAGVMLWDSAGTRRQALFRPVLLRLSGARLEPYQPGGRPLYWRRLQPISDVAYPRDNIWMEQVDARDGRVIWGVVQPKENVVVAAAKVSC